MSDLKQGSKLTTTHKILIAGFSIILIIIIGVAYILLTKQKETDLGESTPLVGSKGYVVDESNIEEIEKQAAQDVADGMFLTKMNMIWGFKTSKEASYNAYVANDETNPNPTYIEVVLTDNNDFVYKSEVMPPGTELGKIKLAKALPKGNYPAICTYFIIDEETQEVKSTLSIDVTINIEG